MKLLRALTLTLISLAAASSFSTTARDLSGSNGDISDVPDSIYVCDSAFHVQGIAIDRKKGCMYYSFTSRFIKTDLKGNVIGSIDRIQGHLGAMTLNPADGKVYASLECKDDEIGAGIAKGLGVKTVEKDQSVFYIAIIDVDKVDRVGCDPETDGVMATVCIKDAVLDYNGYGSTVKWDGVNLNNTRHPHRYGCSGIDAVTFAPRMGAKGGRLYLYVGYGVYSDLDRQDNDNQVLLCYDVNNWSRKYAKPVVFGQMHASGPEKPDGKYFIYTGNTNYGVQNMAYDAATNRIFMAVYKGRKPSFPNYTLFSVDCSQKPVKAYPQGVPGKHSTLKLAQDGLHDDATGIWGWNFRWGSTGLCPVGAGYWLFSENGKKAGKNYCNARLYKWTGNADEPFEKVKR